MSISPDASDDLAGRAGSTGPGSRGESDPRHEAIWDALDAGDPQRALALAEQLRVAPDDGPGRLLVAVARLEASHPQAALEELERLAAVELSEDDEFARRYHLARAAHAAGEPRRALEELRELEPDSDEEHASLLWLRGLCHDHLGRTERADRCLAKAAELDPSGHPLPISITAEEAERIVTQVVDSLPEPLHPVFDELPVVIQDLPGLDLVRAGQGSVPPDLLGLYVGAHLLERSHLDPAGYPPTIFIYRRNLERFVRDRDELAHEIRTTLLHELGHHLGYEEDGLDALGLA